jgi:hypothetical protein
LTARRNPVTGPARPALFKQLRVLFLLLVLLLVAVSNWQSRSRSTSWKSPLYVAVYPIAADQSAVTKAYVAALNAEAFKPLDRFFAEQASGYGVRLDEPVKTRLRPPLEGQPPARASGAGMLATAIWSLRLRYWAWKVGGRSGDPEDVRMFVLYHDPALTPTVPHSLGLAQGLIGVVYAFADPAMTGANDVVIAHELLHTLGASDKYDPVSDAPRFPDGYGNPRQQPLFPQRTAELMAGRRMMSPTRWEQVDSLDEVVIGPSTALEIRWLPLHAQ